MSPLGIYLIFACHVSKLTQPISVPTLAKPTGSIIYGMTQSLLPTLFKTALLTSRCVSGPTILDFAGNMKLKEDIGRLIFAS